MIKREQYLNKLIQFKDKQLIKVISGIRRCGKSTLFELYQSYLKKQGVADNQIISINFEDMQFENLLDYKKLYEYVIKKISKTKKTYIFLDEIQRVKEFQKTVDSLFIIKNADVYITGSNAYILSGELATLLSGRYIEIEMLPLSFKEYLDFADKKSDKKEKFKEYLKYGSFPYITALDNNKEAITEYLKGIYNTVLLKDVVAKNKIQDVMILESVIQFLFHNIGSFISAKKIADTLNSNGRKISVNTVESYLSALKNSYIVYQANRYDIKGKQYLKTLAKYYVVDIGLRNILLNNRNDDIGHVLENIVYLELIRRGYKVSIGKVIGDKEVDFVAINEKQTVYYQVASSVVDSKTLKRELSSLEMIDDHYPKYLITSDDYIDATHNGIKQMNIIDFLLS
ncbi:MAG: ATP-binding protein [Endomicrobiaceae bacterium]|nr:ATP-binding protein [Endomicrobiaceae bacterium]